MDNIVFAIDHAQGQVATLPPDFTLDLGLVANNMSVEFFILNSTFKPYEINNLPSHPSLEIQGIQNGDIIEANEAKRVILRFKKSAVNENSLEDIVFSIGGQKTSIKLKAQYALVFDYMPSFPIKESLVFKTDVFTSQDGHESRAAIISKPNYECSFDVTAKNADEVEEIINFLNYGQKESFFVPKWQKIQKISNYSNGVITLNFDISKLLYPDMLTPTYIQQTNQALSEIIAKKGDYIMIYRGKKDYEISKLKDIKINYSNAYYTGNLMPGDNTTLSLTLENSIYNTENITKAFIVPLFLSHSEKKISYKWIDYKTAAFSLSFKELNLC